MVFNERVTTITQDKYVPLIVDQVLDSNVGVARMFQNTKAWSGETFKQPIRHSLNAAANGGSFSGLDTFTSAQDNTRITLDFEPKAYYRSVIVGGIENAVNQTTAQVLSLVKSELETAADTMIDELGDQYYGDGTGNTGKDFDGQGAIVDDGGTIATYGGQSRTTYPVLQAYEANLTTGGDLDGVVDFGDLKTLLRNTSAASSRKQRPTIGLVDQETFDLVENLYAVPEPSYQSVSLPLVSAFTRPGSTVRDESMLKGAQGFVALSYRGIPIVADDKAPADTILFLNEHYTDFRSLKSNDLESVQLLSNIDSTYSENNPTRRSAPIQWKPFDTPIDQFSKIGQFIMMGNIVNAAPRRNGKLEGVTATA